jgi:hypothetical protein
MIAMIDYQSTLLGRTEVAEGTMAFQFEKPHDFVFKAGQYIDLTLSNSQRGSSNGLTHTFSIASSPFDEELLVTTRMRNTVFKQALSILPIAAELKHLKGSAGVVDLVAGPSGSVWAALEAAGPGLGVRHFADGKWTSYAVPGFDSASVKAHSLFLDRNNALWIGTETQGIYRIHDAIVDHYRSIDGLSGDAVEDIYQDREGNLRVTTDEGLDLFRDTPVVSFSMREGLSDANTSSVLARRDGSVWVGNGAARDVLFEGKLSVIGKHQGLSGEGVTALFEDHSGRLWLGIDDKLLTYEHGRFFEVTQADGSALGHLKDRASPSLRTPITTFG